MFVLGDIKDILVVILFGMADKHLRKTLQRFGFHSSNNRLSQSGMTSSLKHADAVSLWKRRREKTK